jgi:hypothetical protein
MFHVIYASAASHLLTKAELQAMLQETRETNVQVGVTGMLLYKDGSFLQVLEGDEGTCDETRQQDQSRPETQKLSDARARNIGASPLSRLVHGVPGPDGQFP